MARLGKLFDRFNSKTNPNLEEAFAEIDKQRTEGKKIPLEESAELAQQILLTSEAIRQDLADEEAKKGIQFEDEE